MLVRARSRALAPAAQSCEVTFCPCFGFADNYRRAFRSWYIPNWIIFVLCTSLWFWVSVGGYAQCAPLKVTLPLSPPGMALNVQYNATSLAAANATGASNAPAVVDAMTAYNAKLDAARAGNAAWLACNKHFNGAIAGTLLLLFLLLVYGGVRRTAMRKKFGLPGDTLNDMCTWICCAWAALCQETRTLRQNGVAGGTWGGAAQDKTSLLAPGAVEMPPAATAV